MKKESSISVTDEVIAKYLAGEATPEEAMKLHDWLELDEENQIYFKQFAMIWQGQLPARTGIIANIDDAWQELDKQLILPQQATHTTGKTISFSKWLLLAAACCLLVIGISLIYPMRQDRIQAEPIASLQTQATDAPIAKVLPDSSRIVLSAGSALTYSENIGTGPREVSLSGEAFFEVKHDKVRPFIIRTGHSQIKVLGTSFNVESADSMVTVSVKTGKVQFTTGDSSIYLVAGQTGQWSSSSQTFNVLRSVDENTMGYATRRLVLRNTPLWEAISYLEKMYSYKIKLKNDKLAQCPVTVTFDHVTGEYALTILAETLGLQIIRNDNAYFLEGKGCP